MRSVLGFVLALSTLFGCGGANTGESTTPAAAASEPAVAEPEAAPPPERIVAGSIDRGQLVPVLDRGLGYFLQGVGTEPDLNASHEFVGFRLTRLYPADPRFASIDLGPGDTVVRVNGQPIERPEQAIRVWNSLRVASELMIEYLRDGEPRQVRFEIVD